jgi:glycosyltransferase involved in cell wall biosynthesis
MLFTIITPCFNAEKYIAETVNSVLQQTALASGRAALQYIIVDGNSGDRTVEIARDTVAGRQNVEIVSEPDNGMYDALSKGLIKTKGEVCAYINAGDFYSPQAFDIVMDVLEQHPRIAWMTGMQAIYNEKSQMVRTALSYRYRRKWFAAGLYGARLPFVQQESTFWRAHLLDGLDHETLKTLRYAGDFFLWQHFARSADLHIVEAWLAGFKRHAGQLSAESSRYQQELRQLATQRVPFHEQPLIWLDRMCWILPRKARLALNPSTLHSYDHGRQTWT